MTEICYAELAFNNKPSTARHTSDLYPNLHKRKDTGRYPESTTTGFTNTAYCSGETPSTQSGSANERTVSASSQTDPIKKFNRKKLWIVGVISILMCLVTAANYCMVWMYVSREKGPKCSKVDHSKGTSESAICTDPVKSVGFTKSLYFNGSSCVSSTSENLELKLTHKMKICLVKIEYYHQKGQQPASNNVTLIWKEPKSEHKFFCSRDHPSDNINHHSTTESSSIRESVSYDCAGQFGEVVTVTPAGKVCYVQVLGAG